MNLVFKIALVAALHLVFFAGYPETGPYGNYYLAVSLLIWTGFLLFLNTAVKLVRLFSGVLGLALNLAIFGLMALSIAFTMPQEDKTSVLEKVQKRSYPDPDTFRKGLGRFGIDLDKQVSKGSDKLQEEGGKALERAKDKAKDKL